MLNYMYMYVLHSDPCFIDFIFFIQCRCRRRALETFSEVFLLFPCREMIQKHGVCVRALGDLTLLPEDLQRSVARVVKFSQNNRK